MIGVWDWDVPAARIRSDERFARLCGLDPAAAAEGVAVLDVMRLLHPDDLDRVRRSEEHTSELQSLMRISYAVFCLKKKKTSQRHKTHNMHHRQLHTLIE